MQSTPLQWYVVGVRFYQTSSLGTATFSLRITVVVGHHVWRQQPVFSNNNNSSIAVVERFFVCLLVSSHASTWPVSFVHVYSRTTPLHYALSAPCLLNLKPTINDTSPTGEEMRPVGAALLELVPVNSAAYWLLCCMCLSPVLNATLIS